MKKIRFFKEGVLGKMDFNKLSSEEFTHFRNSSTERGPNLIASRYDINDGRTYCTVECVDVDLRDCLDYLESIACVIQGVDSEQGIDIFPILRKTYVKSYDFDTYINSKLIKKSVCFIDESNGNVVELFNYSPHDIIFKQQKISYEDGSEETIDFVLKNMNDIVARVSVTRKKIGGIQDINIKSNTFRYKKVANISKIPINKVYYGEIEGLPDFKEGTFYVVSRVVADAAKIIGRYDCLVPDEFVRDSEGNIIGCRALAEV